MDEACVYAPHRDLGVPSLRILWLTSHSPWSSASTDGLDIFLPIFELLSALVQPPWIAPMGKAVENDRFGIIRGLHTIIQNT